MDKSNGFTLIELIFVVGIIMLLTSISLPYYNTSSEEKKIEAESSRVIDVLELAKKKSSSADISSYSCSGFAGYKVQVNAANYTVSLCCSTGCGTSYLINTYNFDSGISSLTTPTFTFKPKSTGIDSAIDVTVQLKNSRITARNCITVTITPFGLIKSGQKTSC